MNYLLCDNSTVVFWHYISCCSQLIVQYVYMLPECYALLVSQLIG